MIIVLIGAKGSGKTHIGRVLESKLGIHYVNVEPLWMAYHASCTAAGVTPSTRDGITHVHPAIDDALHQYAIVCVDTTGASQPILDALLSLSQKSRLLRVRVDAPLDMCLDRIKRRDTSGQIPCDESVVRKVHELSTALPLSYDLTVENTNFSDDDIAARFRPFLTQP
ncbi:MAG TPA: AAA family ATPase [Planctomycetota bacterium]|nr:AAA family ATPase [Planctomycetota bacterium]